MKIIDLIPHVKKRKSMVDNELMEIRLAHPVKELSLIDEEYTQNKKEEERIFREIQGCESSLRTISHGVHYELGDFEERHFVGINPLELTESLLKMTVEMPYHKMTVGFNYLDPNTHCNCADGDDKRTPMILTIERVLGENGRSYYTVVPWARVSEVGDWVHFPQYVFLVCFSKNVMDIFEEDDFPAELDLFYNNSRTMGFRAIEGKKYDPDDVVFKSDDKGFGIYARSSIASASLDDYENKGIEKYDFAEDMIENYLFKFIYLLNTKGVGAKTIAAPTKLNKKRAKKNKPPLPSYKVLEFKLPKGQTVVGSGGGSKAPSALHTCAGHTKFYSEDRPLFGHYVGPVWCPDHIRGNKKNGIVYKDYALKKEE